MTDFLKDGGSYAVIGLGTSGLSAVNFLAAHGYHVMVVDAACEPSLASRLPAGVKTQFGGIEQATLLAVDGIVISPGVNPLHPSVAAARAAGVPIVSDVQLFVNANRAMNDAPIVAITGSNAKSTVTTLVGEMAKSAGLTVGVGGNLGTPALDLLDVQTQLYVLELSSFQLEAISNLGAAAATILNLSPDHLDRHGDMQGYLNAKLRIFAGAKAAVIHANDNALAAACTLQLANVAGNNILTVREDTPVAASEFGIVQHADELWLAKGETLLVKASELLIKGEHNLINALSALALGMAVGLPMSSMLQTLKAFRGLSHRCEFVANVDGVDYFNDSKGTNIGATVAAIHGLGKVYGTRSLALIVGGQGKGQQFGELADCINDYVHTVLTIGEDACQIEADLTAKNIATPIIACTTLDKAMQTSQGLTGIKAVLLSPACASFDQFKGYADRGDSFVRLVQQMA
ncbi:MAG: UDP-N-acetylmuramoyl-L-alanine--D-glutamate ligase [Moraxella sp.]|nr:UDP-N-acetylmuramoyl-L-alanine--D-glutamate ligase [Moraxella sp.]